MARTSLLRVAVLDDWTNIAMPHLKRLLDDKILNIQIDSFPDTLHVKIPEQFEAQVKRLQPYIVISTMRERSAFPRSLIEKLPNLKLLQTTGPQNRSIDLEACRERGIIVAGTGIRPNPSFTHGPDATNEQTWALILGVIKNLPADDRDVKSGSWQNGLVLNLANRKLGLLGLGRLGQQCAYTGLLGFGMEVIAWSSNLTQQKADEAAKSRGLPAGSFRVCASKEELFREADVLSVHYALSDRSRGIVGEQELSWMKKTAVLVNTSRGPLIDDEALLKALNQGRIRGAGLDVFDTEPLPQDSPFRNPNWGKDGKSILVISPHMGYVDEEMMHIWYEQTAENIKNWVEGQEIKFIFDELPSS